MRPELAEIEGVGYDLDNTLYFRTSAVQARIQEYTAEAVARRLDRPLAEIRSAYEEKFERLQSGSRSLEELGIPIQEARELVQEGLEKADVASALARDERLVNLLAQIGINRKQFLITGSAEAEAHRKLEALGISPDVFRLRLYANSPHKRLGGTAYYHVAKELSIPLGRIMFIGDRESVDIIPAKQLGLKTAIVNAKSAQADYQLSSIYDLEELLL